MQTTTHLYVRSGDCLIKVLFWKPPAPPCGVQMCSLERWCPQSAASGQLIQRDAFLGPFFSLSAVSEDCVSWALSACLFCSKACLYCVNLWGVGNALHCHLEPLADWPQCLALLVSYCTYMCMCWCKLANVKPKPLFRHFGILSSLFTRRYVCVCVCMYVQCSWYILNASKYICT